VFVVVTIFGVWLGIQVKWIKDRHEALKWVDTINARRSPGDSSDFSQWSHVIVSYDRVVAPWQIRILGESGVPEIHIDQQKINKSDDASGKLLELESLFPEAHVSAQ